MRQKAERALADGDEQHRLFLMVMASQANCTVRRLITALYLEPGPPHDLPKVALEQIQKISEVSLWLHDDLNAFGPRGVRPIEDLPRETQETVLKYGHDVFMYFVAEAWQLPPGRCEIKLTFYWRRPVRVAGYIFEALKMI